VARNMARYNPRSDLLRQAAFPDIGNLLRGLSMAPVLRELEQAPRMKVDIEETDQAYILRADVPGANREDITVTVDGNTVAITANVEQQRVDPNGNMITLERIYGEEYRVFTLPQEVDESKAEARIENGVLVLTLPKKSGAGAKKLDIRQEAAGGSAQGKAAGGAGQAAGGAGQAAGGAGQAAGGAAQAQPAAAPAQGQSAASSTKGQSGDGAGQSKSS
jgi:HSP20 family protein